MPSRAATSSKPRTASRPNPLQSVEKALRVLNVFSLAHPTWGIRELGRELNLHPTTVFRLLKTLEQGGYIEREYRTRQYALGPKVVELASLYTHLNPLPSVALKTFESYHSRFPYNFYLGALHGYQVIYLARLEGRGPIRVSAEPGDRIVLHSSALGKVLLAFQDEAFVSEFLKKHRLKAFTPRTVTDREALRTQLEEVRRQEWALNDGEHYQDVSAVAVPVHNRQGQIVAAVSLAFPRYLLSERRIQVPALVSLAQEIGADLSAHA